MTKLTISDAILVHFILFCKMSRVEHVTEIVCISSQGFSFNITYQVLGRPVVQSCTFYTKKVKTKLEKWNQYILLILVLSGILNKHKTTLVGCKWNFVAGKNHSQSNKCPFQGSQRHVFSPFYQSECRTFLSYSQ